MNTYPPANGDGGSEALARAEGRCGGLRTAIERAEARGEVDLAIALLGDFADAVRTRNALAEGA